MARQLPYELSYNTISLWRTIENCSLWVFFIISMIIGLLQIKCVNDVFDLGNLIQYLHILSYISFTVYGVLYIVVEIIMQPITASERRKGFIDNSLGTKLLSKPVTKYYDNDFIKTGAYKMMVNCYENCYFTYNIVKEMLLCTILKNVVLFLILLFFAYYGIHENPLVITILELFLSSLFLIELAYHINFYFKLKNLCEQFRSIFIAKNTTKKTLQSAIYMVLEYETALAYNKSPNSDKVYNRLKEKLTQEWEDIKNRYDIK